MARFTWGALKNDFPVNPRKPDGTGHEWSLDAWYFKKAPQVIWMHGARSGRKGDSVHAIYGSPYANCIGCALRHGFLLIYTVSVN